MTEDTRGRPIYRADICHFLIYIVIGRFKVRHVRGQPRVIFAVERAAAACEGPQAKTFGRFNNSPGR